MLININLDDYTDDKCVMHCNTREKAEAFLRFLHNAGRTWISGGSYLDRNYWEVYMRNTCYAFNIGEYANVDYYETYGYTVLEIDDFIMDDYEYEEDETLVSFLGTFGHALM